SLLHSKPVSSAPSSRFNKTVLTMYSSGAFTPYPMSFRFNETVLTTLQRRSHALRTSSTLRSIRIVPV
ncbi:hypothetical protein K440DRAFT_629395, partial [Wilcoxina mikolae CBS 423.85]